MFRASIILKNARQDHSLEISEVSKKLKISAKYIESIETENKSKFPQEPYCSLIIKDYANYLGLNGDDILSLFRRDFANTCQNKTKNSRWQFFTPQSTFKIAVIVSIVFFATYLIIEYLKFNQAPSLIVNWPSSTNLSQLTLDLTGITDPESTIRINNDLIIVDEEGKFSKKFTFSSSDSSTIIVESKSPSGKITTLEKTFHLDEKLKN